MPFAVAIIDLFFFTILASCIRTKTVVHCVIYMASDSNVLFLFVCMLLVCGLLGMLHKMSDDQWDTMIKVHNTAPFRLVRAAAPYMRGKIHTILL